MKKLFLSLLAKRPVAPNPTRTILIAATAFLAQAALGPALFAGPGGSSRVRGADKIAPADAVEVTAQPQNVGSVRRVDKSGHVYLRVLGPTPLRLQSTNAPPQTVMLPPLVMDDPAPVQAMASSRTNNSGTNINAALQPLATPSADGSPPPPESNSLLSDPTLGAATAAPIVTPQMLVQFFKPVGSNNLGGAWSMPVFVPPSPPPSKSSTATYQSP